MDGDFRRLPVERKGTRNLDRKTDSKMNEFFHSHYNKNESVLPLAVRETRTVSLPLWIDSKAST